jgi:hypothetical protein
MRADDWSIVDPSARGRDSVRISSQSAYDEAIFVLDLAHMPAGCATWPAFWSLSKQGPWPAGGEIDIIEGMPLVSLVSLLSYPCTYSPVQVSICNSKIRPLCILLPIAQCLPMISASHSLGRSFLRVHARTLNLILTRSFFNRTTLDTDCNTAVNSNAGCGVSFTDSGPSYGSDFNMNRGGYFVMVKSRMFGVQVYFWPQNSINVPPEIRDCGSGGGSLFPNPSWGSPAANFPMCPGYCDYDSHFNAHQIVFDLTFCVRAMFICLLLLLERD